MFNEKLAEDFFIFRREKLFCLYPVIRQILFQVSDAGAVKERSYFGFIQSVGLVMDDLEQVWVPVFLHDSFYHSDPGPKDIFCRDIRIHGVKDFLIKVPFPCQKQDLLYLVFLHIAVDPLTESHNINPRIDKTYFIIGTVLLITAVELRIDDPPVGRTCQTGHILCPEHIPCFVYILIEPGVQAFLPCFFYI